MSSQPAKKRQVIIGTISNGEGHTMEITASQRGIGNAAVQQREAAIRSIREAVHDAASQAHYVFHPGQAPKPQTLKKRKHYPKKGAQQGGKKTRKHRSSRKRRMTRRK